MRVTNMQHPSEKMRAELIETLTANILSKRGIPAQHLNFYIRGGAAAAVACAAIGVESDQDAVSVLSVTAEVLVLLNTVLKHGSTVCH